MHRLLTLIVIVFLAGCMAAAQSGAAQNPPPPPAGHDHAAHHPQICSLGGMKDHEHAMGQMHASLDTRQTTLQKMKAGLAGIKDPPPCIMNRDSIAS